MCVEAESTSFGGVGSLGVLVHPIWVVPVVWRALLQTRLGYTFGRSALLVRPSDPEDTYYVIIMYIKQLQL